MVFFIHSWYSDNKMKRVLYFAIIYLASIVIGTLIFATLFMFSCNLNMFVTGLPSSFFSLHFFMTGILLSVPLVCVLIQILLVLYIIRHPKCHILSLIIYALFGLLSWLVFIPIDIKLISRYESDVVSSRVEASSAGVFRKEASGVYYYTRIDDDGSADGLFLDTTGYLGQEGAVLPLFDVSVKNESAFPYSDILIKNSLQPPLLVTYPLSIYNALLTAGSYSSSLGFLAWLAFASMGLALIAVYGIQFLSSWKLANVVSVIVCAFGVLFINYLYYMNILPELLKELSTKLSNLTQIKDPLIILINILITLVFIVFGIFMGIYRLRGSSILESDE